MNNSAPPANAVLADNIQRAPNLWYPDGSIILLAGTHGFRVHWGVLSARASFFRTMFTLPQPEDENHRRVEGTPVIDVQDDAEDLRHFLLAIYDPSYFPGNVKAGLGTIASILRMSTKYGHPELRLRAITIFSTLLPSTLLDNDMKTLQSSLVDLDESSTSDLLTLALTTDATVLLPSLYWTIAGMSAPMFLDNASLPQNTLRDVLRGREAVLSHRIRVVQNIVRAAFSNPDQLQYCRTVLGDWLQKLMEIDNARLTFLASLPMWAFPDMPAHMHCVHCRPLVQMYLEGREEIWTKIPGWFKLPPWPKLLMQLTLEDQEERIA